MPQTYRQQFESAMQCQTEQEAAVWIEAEVLTYKQEHDIDRDKALHIIKTNLGYMAGYYDHATVAKVEKLFGANHPILGRSYF